MDLASLAHCWRLTREHHAFNAPTRDHELNHAERELHHRLPDALRELYRFSNGLSLCDGNFTLYPLGKNEDPRSLVSATPWLRECGWPIPEEVLIFGDDGSGNLYGLWLGEKSKRFSGPIIEVGGIFEPGCMALTATCLFSFLAVQTAYFLNADRKGKVAQETLGIPESLLGNDEGDEEILELLRRWADPILPETPSDPYISQLDAAALRRLLI